MCLGGLGLTAVISSCTANYYAIATASADQLIIKKSEFIEVKNGVSKPRKYILIRTEKLKFPVCIYKLNENTYSSLLMECTHNSCELNPHGDYLVCPCHGAEFNNLGKVQSAPAEIDLLSFKTTHDNENIYVHLS